MCRQASLYACWLHVSLSSVRRPGKTRNINRLKLSLKNYIAGTKILNESSSKHKNGSEMANEDKSEYIVKHVLNFVKYNEFLKSFYQQNIDLNVQLQGNNHTILKIYKEWKSFTISKSILFKTNIKNLTNFIFFLVKKER